MTWENNARTPQDKVKERIESARTRLNGILAQMVDEQKYAVFYANENGPKKLLGVFTKSLFEAYHANDDILFLSVGSIHGIRTYVLFPVTGAIEAYL